MGYLYLLKKPGFLKPNSTGARIDAVQAMRLKTRGEQAQGLQAICLTCSESGHAAWQRDHDDKRCTERMNE